MALIRIRDLQEASPITGRGIDMGLGNVEQTIAGLALDINPPYQREHVWEMEQRELFVGHVLQGFKVPALIVRVVGDDESFELLDGKQRLTSLRMWVSGELGARIGERLIFIQDTDRSFPNRLTVRIDYARCATEADVYRLYLRLNSGVAHTQAELARVRAMLAAEEARAAGRVTP